MARPTDFHRKTALHARLVCSVTAMLLCLPMVLSAEPAAPASHPGKKENRVKGDPGRLTPDQRTLHALNRFTFGPKPGEEAALKRMGLDRWFEQQLHPERIADDSLAARLAQYPAMRLPQEELVTRFPTPAMLRRFSRGEVPSPADATERAIYADGAYRYQEKNAAKQDASAPPTNEHALTKTGVETAQASAPVYRSVAGERAAAPDALALKTAVLQLPPEARLQRMVAMSPEEMAAFHAAVKGPDQARLDAGMTPDERETTAALRSPERMVDNEVLSTRLLRDVYSERQLQAVMTDFWLNHFNVYLRKNQNEPYLLPAYERDAVLPHALGRFEDLLAATAESPAMLLYLDNAESVGPNSIAAVRGRRVQQVAFGQEPTQPPKAAKGINENYARELMELHTLGVNGGYTQQDVIEVAKCFTGWTIARPAEGGTFEFNANRHEPGPKVVLGHTIPESGMQEGLAVLHLLATSPATAHFLSEELAERFVSDIPPTALVNRMAATYLKSDGDISAVLKTLFSSPEFWSPAVYRAKVKTPLEFAVSAVRATNAEVNQPLPLVQAMERLGMPIYGMQTPNGYSWQAETWVSSNALLTRMNFALVLSGNRLQGTRIAVEPLVQAPTSADKRPDANVESELEMALLGQPASEKTRVAVLNGATAPGVQRQAQESFRTEGTRSLQASAFEAGPAAPRVKAKTPGANQPEDPVDTLAGLLLGSPEFQRR